MPPTPHVPPWLVRARDRKQPILWGYARSSSAKQEMSPAEQKDRIIAKARLLAEEGRGVMPDPDFCIPPPEHISATEVPYWERPGFARLLDLMRAGDLLIVWRTDRIDRKTLRFFKALWELLDRGVGIYLLDQVGREMDLENVVDLLLLSQMGAFAQWDSETRTAACKAGQRAAAGRGHRVNRFVPLGMVKTGHKTVAYDPAQCRVLCELVARRRGGQTFRAIHAAFRAAGYRKGDGSPWAPLRSRRRRSAPRRALKIMSLVLPDRNRLHGRPPGGPIIDGLQDAYWWAERNLLENRGMMGGIVPYEGPANAPVVTLDALPPKTRARRKLIPATAGS